MIQSIAFLKRIMTALILFALGVTLLIIAQLYLSGIILQPASSKAIDPLNQQKIIYLTGKPTSYNLTDTMFNLKINGLGLKRTIEVYQLTERNGSVEKIWSKEPIPTPKNAASNEANPSKIALPSQESPPPPELAMGPYKFDNRFSPILLTYAPYGLKKSDFEQLNNYGKKAFKLHDNSFYYSLNPSSPAVGDIRISFEYIPAKEISIVAQQIGTTLRPFVYEEKLYTVLSTAPLSSTALLDRFNVPTPSPLLWPIRGGAIFLLLLGLIFTGLAIKKLLPQADKTPPDEASNSHKEELDSNDEANQILSAESLSKKGSHLDELEDFDTSPSGQTDDLDNEDASLPDDEFYSDDTQDDENGAEEEIESEEEERNISPLSFDEEDTYSESLSFDPLPNDDHEKETTTPKYQEDNLSSVIKTEDKVNLPSSLDEDLPATTAPTTPQNPLDDTSEDDILEEDESDEEAPFASSNTKDDIETTNDDFDDEFDSDPLRPTEHGFPEGVEIVGPDTAITATPSPETQHTPLPINSAELSSLDQSSNTPQPAAKKNYQEETTAFVEISPTAEEISQMLQPTKTPPLDPTPLNTPNTQEEEFKETAPQEKGLPSDLTSPTIPEVPHFEEEKTTPQSLEWPGTEDVFAKQAEEPQPSSTAQENRAEDLNDLPPTEEDKEEAPVEANTPTPDSLPFVPPPLPDQLPLPSTPSLPKEKGLDTLQEAPHTPSVEADATETQETKEPQIEEAPNAQTSEDNGSTSTPTTQAPPKQIIEPETPHFSPEDFEDDVSEVTSSDYDKRYSDDDDDLGFEIPPPEEDSKS